MKAKNESWDYRDTGQRISMGEKVGGRIQSLKLTACVHVEEREIIAAMRMFMTLFPEEKEFNKWIQERATPAFIELGHGKWYRDVITDLALALGGKRDNKTVQKVDESLLE